VKTMWFRLIWTASSKIIRINRLEGCQFNLFGPLARKESWPRQCGYVLLDPSYEPNETLMRAYNTGQFDFFFLALDAARDRFPELPPALPWVEPSINMPHLQACASYVMGQNLGSILLTAVLLEHALRLAVIDRKAGRQGSMDEKLWKEYSNFSIGQFFKKEAPTIKTLIDDTDVDWWTDFAAKVVRNKAAHLDIPIIIKHLGRWEEYVGIYKDNADEELIFSNRFWWGAVFHRTDALVALGFIREATEKLRNLIVKSGWTPDRSHWASQEWHYNSFFTYPWTLEAMTASLQRIPRNMPVPPSPSSD
jgi:hypothetical protein